MAISEIRVIKILNLTMYKRHIIQNFKWRDSEYIFKFVKLEFNLYNENKSTLMIDIEDWHVPAVGLNLISPSWHL